MPAHMKIGFAKRDITPQPGVYLSGNGEHKSERVHDHLYTRAVVIETDTCWAALVVCDLIGLDHASIRNVRLMLADTPGCNTDHIFISCTHTHNGPHTSFTRLNTLQHRDEVYMQFLEAAIAAAITEASHNTQSATMKVARGFSFENFNRRLITPDGQSHFYNPGTLRRNPGIVSLVGGVTDPELNAIQFHDTDGKAILTMVHYQAHPLTIGAYENVLSSDFCGPLVENIEKLFDAPAMFVQGSAGDLHSKGLFAGFDRQREMADNLSAEVQRILSEPNLALHTPQPRIHKSRIALKVNSAKRDQDGWNPDVMPDTYHAEIGAMALGPVVFTPSPAELFACQGLEIKSNSGFEQTWVAYNCNNYCGYIPPPRAWIEGGYEPSVSCFFPDTGPQLVNSMIQCCKALSVE